MSDGIAAELQQLITAVATLQTTANNLVAQVAALSVTPRTDAPTLRLADVAPGSPNVDATPQSVSDKIDGLDGNGLALPYRRAAMFYEANMLGLSKDYAFPEGPNTSPSMEDQSTSLSKLLTRCHTLADGNSYDLWDAVMTLAKALVVQSPHINDDEPNSVNYKARSA